MKTAKAKTRTLVVLSLSVTEDADTVDGMSFEERRRNSMGWEELTVLHAGSPDAVAREALDLGVFGGERLWDKEAKCVVDTRYLAPADVKSAAKTLARHAAKPAVLAARLMEHIGAEASKDDARRVASALVQENKTPARGPAEEAAAWIRAFLERTSTAIQFKLGIVWELRTPAKCRCATIEDELPGKVDFKRGSRPVYYRLLASSPTGGRVRCKTCKATFAYSYGRLSTTITREAARPKKKATPPKTNVRSRR